MSIRWMLKALEAKVGNPARKLVLVKLCDNANDEGLCWPSYPYIAEHCEISERSAMSHVKALVKEGFITKTARKGVKGNGTNVYKMTFARGEEIAPPVNIAPPRGEKSAPPPSANIAPLEESAPLRGADISPHSENSAPGGEIFAPPRGENSAPGTCHSFEPVIEEEKEALLGVPSSNLFTPEKTHANKYSMAETWQPSESFAQACRFQGINLGKFSADDQEDLINEFRGYWMTQSTQLNQAGWEHKLISNLKRNQAHKLKTEKQSAGMDWDDLSWADDLNEGLI